MKPAVWYALEIYELISIPVFAFWKFFFRANESFNANKSTLRKGFVLYLKFTFLSFYKIKIVNKVKNIIFKK